jgi:hypothetical protein
MNTTTINPPIKVGAVVVPPLLPSPQLELKGVTFEFAMGNSNEAVQQVLLQMYPLLQHKHKYVSVFVKPMHTTIGKPTCIEGWHFDTVENPLSFPDVTPEVHHIWVGYSNDTTQFITTKVALTLDGTEKLADIRGMVEEQPYEVVSIPANTIVTYNRFNLHRGPICSAASYRLLVRVSETDIFFGAKKVGKIAITP